ncbi:MAG: hypothetical protein ACTSRK_09350 [Promethearchaeota archaeon]
MGSDSKYPKYQVIVERPMGGTEHFEFLTLQDAENLVGRFKKAGNICRITTSAPLKSVLMEDVASLKKSLYYSSFKSTPDY